MIFYSLHLSSGNARYRYPLWKRGRISQKSVAQKTWAFTTRKSRTGGALSSYTYLCPVGLTSSRTILNFVNYLFCARITGKLSIFFAKIFSGYSLRFELQNSRGFEGHEWPELSGKPKVNWKMKLYQIFAPPTHFDQNRMLTVFCQ